jgi:predicted GNAT family acetyltransferase
MMEANPGGGDVRVVNDPDERRYELWVDNELVGGIAYRMPTDTMYLVDTQVDDALRGRGLGQRLVASALEDIRGRGLKIAPVCPFVRWYLRKHPEDADLVVPRWMGRV